MPLDNDFRTKAQRELENEGFAPVPAEEIPAEPAPAGTPLPSQPLPVPNPIPVRPAPVPNPIPIRPMPTPTPVPIRPAPVPTPAPAQEKAPDQSCPAVMDRLASIERSIRTLHDQLANISTAVDDCNEKTSDPEALYTKINAVHTDVKKLRDDFSQMPEPVQPTDRTEELLAQLQAVTEKQEKTERMLIQALRENASFQQQVRQGMQRDLDDLRKQLSGTAYNAILKEIASMYCEYQFLLEDEQLSKRSLNNLLSLFGQMEDLLADYEAEVVVSKVGDLRPKNQCKITEKIPTGDESLHNTIARSRKPGVIRDRLVLFHEYVDVYVYDPSLKIEAEEPATEDTPQDLPAPMATETDLPSLPAEPGVSGSPAPTLDPESPAEADAESHPL